MKKEDRKQNAEIVKGIEHDIIQDAELERRKEIDSAQTHELLKNRKVDQSQENELSRRKDIDSAQTHELLRNRAVDSAQAKDIEALQSDVKSANSKIEDLQRDIASVAEDVSKVNVRLDAENEMHKASADHLTLTRVLSVLGLIFGLTGLFITLVK